MNHTDISLPFFSSLGQPIPTNSSTQLRRRCVFCKACGLWPRQETLSWRGKSIICSPNRGSPTKLEYGKWWQTLEICQNLGSPIFRQTDFWTVTTPEYQGTRQVDIDYIHIPQLDDWYPCRPDFLRAARSEMNQFDHSENWSIFWDQGFSETNFFKRIEPTS